MKLNEMLPVPPPSKYKRPDPSSGINWDIPEHPKYKLYPELQDAIFAGLSKLSPADKKALLAKYNVTNSLDLHVLPVEQMFKLEQELDSLGLIT